MNKLVVTFSVSLAVLCASACTPGQNGSGSGSPEAGKAPVAQGTVSGGGGNGCEGKAFETYAKKISSLEEYQLYLRPLLRRMAESSRDPFVTYLLWAAEDKAWYFVPCELEKLSSEQIGVAVQSDQLARHGENGIFIYSNEAAKAAATPEDPNRPNYATKKLKVKATLLLHEMVMGARMLMKKPPLDQCKALAKRDAKFCSDPETMAIVQASPFDPQQAGVMDAADHDAVRAMTTFLAQKDVDLSTASIRATRERLGFNFPWSLAVSEIDLSALNKLFNRAALLEDRFKVVADDASKIYFKGLEMTCAMLYHAETRNDSSDFNIWFVSNLVSGVSGDHLKFREYFADSVPTSSFCAPTADRVVFLQVDSNIWPQNVCPTKESLIGSARERFGVWIRRDEYLRSRGVLVNGVVYDQVTIRASQPTVSGNIVDLGLVQILVTRDKSPRIFSVRMTPKQVLKAPGSGPISGKDIMRDDLELLDIPGAPAIECRNQSLAQ